LNIKYTIGIVQKESKLSFYKKNDLILKVSTITLFNLKNYHIFFGVILSTVRLLGAMGQTSLGSSKGRSYNKAAFKT